MIVDLNSMSGGEPEGLPQNARDYLNRLYSDEGADTIEKKIALLEKLEGAQSNFHATGIDGKEIPVPLETKLAAYELCLAIQEGFVDVPFC